MNEIERGDGGVVGKVRTFGLGWEMRSPFFKSQCNIGDREPISSIAPTMNVDLFTADFGSLSNDLRYAAIASLAQAQPMESNRHDFKTVWTNDAIKDVAAFANTFGGLLVIGVEKNQSDHTARAAGIQSNSE